MEVIKQISKEDINSALNRVDQSLRAGQLSNVKMIESAAKDLEEKYKDAENFQDKLALYNKVITVMIAIIQDYCKRRKITVLPAAIQKWQNTYKTAYKCESGNAMTDEVYIDWEDFTLKNTCTYCFGNNTPCNACYDSCQTCNKQQTTCTTNYNDSLINFCSSNFDNETYSGTCTSQYSSCTDVYTGGGIL